MKRIIAILLAVLLLSALTVVAAAADQTVTPTNPVQPVPVTLTVAQDYLITIPASIELDGSEKTVSITATCNLVPGNTLTVSSADLAGGSITLTNTADASVTVQPTASLTGSGWTGRISTAVEGYSLVLGAITDAQAGNYSSTINFSIAIQNP